MKIIYHWAGKAVHKPYASFLFFLLVTIEGFFFMPSSTLFMLYSLEQRKKTFFYAVLAILASIVGAAFAYGVGYFLWDTIGKLLITYLMNPHTFEKMVGYYTQYQVAAVLIAGFLPLPYKVITLTAGFCHIPFLPFIICCAVSRALRFVLLGLAIAYWGDRIQQILDHYFYHLVVLAICMLILSGWLIH